MSFHGMIAHVRLALNNRTVLFIRKSGWGSGGLLLRLQDLAGPLLALPSVAACLSPLWGEPQLGRTSKTVVGGRGRGRGKGVASLLGAESKRVPRNPCRKCPLTSLWPELGHVSASGWPRGKASPGSP